MKTFLGASCAGAAVLLAGPVLALGICIEGAYPPFSQVLDDGSIVGFDIDVANALCAEMGESCHFVQKDWTRLIPALNGQDCDAIVASMSSTEQRRALIDFSDRYYKSPVRFVGAEGSGLTDSEDVMAGKVVGVQLGTINQYYMQAHYPETALRLYGNQEHLLLDLYSGRVDAVLGEAVQLDTGFLKTPAGAGFAFFGAPLFDPAIQGEGAAVGVRKDEPELRDRFSQAIAAMRNDGTYSAISEKYFDFDIYGD